MLIHELHSTDLTQPCLHAVKLRHEGKIVGEMPTAMYLGNLFHAAVRIYHESGCDADVSPMIHKAHEIIAASSNEENRPLTNAVERSIDEHQQTCYEWMQQYNTRLGDMFRAGKFIGCELPIRYTLEVDGEDALFASHTDLLYRINDTLRFFDWKTGEDTPTQHYLSRNLQMGLNWLAFARGSVCIGGEWIEFGEEPRGTWIHVRNLVPYGRGGSGRDEDGNAVAYKKGDQRPLNRILFDVPFSSDCIDAAIDEMTTRVRMNRMDLWPKNPDPVRCHICASNMYCTSFSYKGNTNEAF